ncbi:hypothetical protein D7V86_24460 [bacterium D16-51]|nr:hypothetical protein D7V96_24825 [bacterium D16-59]RKI53930.1 hypothetical protein D7V86_24460 [bacterium D16-51]
MLAPGLLITAIDTGVIQSYFTNMASKLRAAIETAFGAVTEFNFSGLGSAIGQGITSFFRKMSIKNPETGLNGWEELGQTISDSILGITDTITVALETVPWKEVGQAIADFIKNIKWKEVVWNLGEMFSAFVQAFKDLLTGSGMSDSMADVIVNVAVGGWIIKKISKTALLKAIANKLGSKLSIPLKRVGAVVKNWFANKKDVALSKLKAKIVKGLGKITTTLEKVGAKVKSWLAKKKDLAVEKLKEKIEKVIGKISSTFKNVSANVKNWVAEKVNKSGLIEKIKEKMGKITATLKDVVAKVYNWIAGKVNKTGLKEKVEEKIENLNPSVKNATATVEKWETDKETKQLAKEAINDAVPDVVIKPMIGVEVVKWNIPSPQLSLPDKQIPTMEIPKINGKIKEIVPQLEDKKAKANFISKLKGLIGNVKGINLGSIAAKIKSVIPKFLDKESKGSFLVKLRSLLGVGKGISLGSIAAKIKSAIPKFTDEGTKKRFLRKIKKLLGAVKGIDMGSISAIIKKVIPSFGEQEGKKSIISDMADKIKNIIPSKVDTGKDIEIKGNWKPTGLKDSIDTAIKGFGSFGISLVVTDLIFNEGKNTIASNIGHVESQIAQDAKERLDSGEITKEDVEKIKEITESSLLKDFVSAVQNLFNGDKKEVNIKYKTETEEIDKANEKMEPSERTIAANFKSNIKNEKKWLDRFKTFNKANSKDVVARFKSELGKNWNKRYEKYTKLADKTTEWKLKALYANEASKALINNPLLTNKGKSDVIKKTMKIDIQLMANSKNVTDKFTAHALDAVFGTLSKKARGGIYKNGKWGDVTKYASGGLPGMGQMFIAREAGPELVGTIGGHTAVMNNNQIVASVSDGVFNALSPVLTSLVNAINLMVSASANGNGDVYVEIDGDNIARVVRRKNSDYRKRTGKGMFEV